MHLFVQVNTRVTIPNIRFMAKQGCHTNHEAYGKASDTAEDSIESFCKVFLKLVEEESLLPDHIYKTDENRLLYYLISSNTLATE